MKTILIIGSIFITFLFLTTGKALAPPIAPHLVDAKPPEAQLFDAEK